MDDIGFNATIGLICAGLVVVCAQNIWLFFTACDFQANTNHRMNENSRLIKFLVDRNAEDRKLIGHLTRRVEELESKFVTTSMRIDGVEINEGEWINMADIYNSVDTDFQYAKVDNLNENN